MSFSIEDCRLFEAFADYAGTIVNGSMGGLLRRVLSTMKAYRLEPHFIRTILNSVCSENEAPHNYAIELLEPGVLEPQSRILPMIEIMHCCEPMNANAAVADELESPQMIGRVVLAHHKVISGSDVAPATEIFVGKCDKCRIVYVYSRNRYRGAQR